MSGDLNKLDKVVLMEFFTFIGTFVLATAFIFTNFFAYLYSRSYGFLLIFIVYLGAASYVYCKYFLAAKAYRHYEDELKIPLNSCYGEAIQGQATFRAFNKVD
jgi:hypothetical protein